MLITPPEYPPAVPIWLRSYVAVDSRLPSDAAVELAGLSAGFNLPAISAVRTPVSSVVDSTHRLRPALDGFLNVVDVVGVIVVNLASLCEVSKKV